MDDRQLLSARMVAAVMDLRMAQRVMARYSPQASAIASARSTLDNRLERHLADVRGLLQGLAGPQAIATGWAHFAELQGEVRSTTNEVLALVQGGPLRDAEQGGGIYALADALIREVAADLGRAWVGITLPGEREQLTTRSSIIHLTFPQVSIWDLPIVLHEYGHAVAPEIRNDLGQSPFQLMCRAAGSGVERSHLTELFADAFATWACGPALVCTLVILRFDPMAEEAIQDLPTHPSHARRMALVLRVLEERNHKIKDATWAALVAELGAAWQSSLEMSRPELEEPASDFSASAVPGGPFSRILEILDLVPQAAYRSWERTQRLVPLLAGEGFRERPEESITIRDALNAAWLARMRSPAERLNEIGERAEHLIRSLASGAARSASVAGAGQGGGALDR